MRRIDLSMPLEAAMPNFPDDPPFAIEPSITLGSGGAYNVSKLSFTTHAGTHVDPPRHFLERGTPVDQLDLGALNGPCRIVDIRPDVRAIGLGELPLFPPGTERVLFRTSNSARWAKREKFFPDYVALSPAAAVELVRRKVRMVGIDSLSIESDPSGQFPVHHTLLGGGIPILEGLLLEEAPSGVHDLVCLPLRIRDGDGGPARAVLCVE